MSGAPQRSGPSSEPAEREASPSVNTLSALVRLWKLTGARRQWASLIPLSLAVTACELAGLGLVFALIHLLDAGDLPEELAGGAWAALLPGAGRPAGERAALFAVLVAAVYLVKNAAKLIEVMQRERLAARASVALSTRLFAHYLGAPYTFHLRTHSGDLIRNVRNSIDRATYTGMLSATALVSELVIAASVIAFVLLRAPWPALAASVVVLGVTVVALQVVQRVHSRAGRDAYQLHGEINKLLQDSLQGVREIKVFRREAFFAEAYRQARERLGHTNTIHGLVAWLPRVTVETAFICGLAALVLVSVRGGSADTRLLPLVGLFAFAGLRLLPSLTTSTYHLGQLRFSRAHIEHALCELEAAAAQPPEQERDPLPLREAIRFEHVSYTYPDAGKSALDDVQLTIARGESVGVVGPTGAGKSTLVGLLTGLLQPSSGRIRIDDVDLVEHIRAWRGQIGYVPQSIFLLDATLRENVALGVDPAEVDEERLRRAVEIAQLGDFLEALPQGLDTRVGEHGVRISGGERQRLAVARALYTDPEVLVFDEATASLDNRTEHALTESIEYLQGKKTMVIIAHRLSTVRRCDRLVFLSEGRLKAVGTFDELLERDAEFERVVYPDGRRVS